MNSANNVIQVSSLSKVFRIYSRPIDLFWESLLGQVRSKEFWALKDVTFNIKSGEVVGIVGRNGAGKSTLLKIIAGTLNASSGSVKVNGSISSILELGTGFNGEFSGRENILFGGLLAGLTRAEVFSKLDEIIEFSELGDFIDQPFKTYSSGMQARLAFSTVTAREADILIVDEALSVGDVKFQRKSFSRFENLKKQGKTILFVSHNPQSIIEICSQAILLDQGKVIEIGTPKNVIDLYEKMVFSPKADVASNNVVNDLTETDARSAKQGLKALINREQRYGNRKAEITEFGIMDSDGALTTKLISGEKYTLISKIEFNEDLNDINIGFGIKTVKGFEVFATNTHIQKVQIPPQKKGASMVASASITMWLSAGDYFVSFGAWGFYADSHYDRRVDALHIHVDSDALLLANSVVNLQPSIDIKYS